MFDSCVSLHAWGCSKPDGSIFSSLLHSFPQIFVLILPLYFNCKCISFIFFLLILIYSFCFWQQIKTLGEPFLLMINDGETLSHIKVRVQNKLQVRDEEFSKVFQADPNCYNHFKWRWWYDAYVVRHATTSTFCLNLLDFMQWRFAFVSHSQAEYLEDSDTFSHSVTIFICRCA